MTTQLIQAKRLNNKKVAVTYKDDNLEEFTVHWSCIDSVGDIFMLHYDLTSEVVADNETTKDIVEQAISNGESDKNEYIDLYLTIRDTFDCLDCINFDIHYDEFKITKVDFEYEFTFKNKKEFKAFIVIDDLFLVCVSSDQFPYIVSSSVDGYWIVEDNQIWAENNLEIVELIQALENKYGFKNTAEWLHNFS